MNAEQLRQLNHRKKLMQAERSKRVEEYLQGGGDPDKVIKELIPTHADAVRLEHDIRDQARKAERQPKGKARDRKIDALIPLVAELCVMERILALDPLVRAGLRPRQIAEMAKTSPQEMYGKLAELVAGVVGGGDAPKIEVPGG